MDKKDESFHFNHIHIFKHPEVYEPAEDTFLLLDSIDVTKDDKVFEIGTGTGIIALHCAKQGSHVVCSDINPYAIDLVTKNLHDNKKILKGTLEIRKGSLFDVLKDGEQFSLIIFNPPYLPTSKHELIDGTGWFDIAVSGGKNGLDLTIMFISNLSRYLKEQGRAFTIFSSKSPRNVFNQTLEKNQLKSKIVSTQSFTDETIEVHIITKKKKN